MLTRAPAVLLRLEGLAVAVAAIVVYFDGGRSWILFVALALAPDASIAAFAFGLRAGTAAYDALHTYAIPVVLVAVGVVGDVEWVVSVALIWLAHIGVDRLLGYGLKYPSAFKDTHLQRV